LAAADFLGEVQYLAEWPDRLRLLDPALPRQLADVFARHPWVERVEGVRVEPDRALVAVRLAYRRPVLAGPGAAPGPARPRRGGGARRGGGGGGGGCCRPWRLGPPPCHSSPASPVLRPVPRATAGATLASRPPPARRPSSGRTRTASASAGSRWTARTC